MYIYVWLYIYMRSRATSVNVMLYPEDVEKVEKIRAALGLKSRSEVVRYAINMLYNALQQQQQRQ